MRVLVTGAASPLGRQVVTTLVRDGHRVKGMVRRLSGVSRMQAIGAQPVTGDPRRLSVVTSAMEGCDIVIHLAGYFDFWEPARGLQEDVNVGGTRAVLAGALRVGVRRMVLGSSALTIGEPVGTVGSEYSMHRGHTHTECERTALEAERLALGVRERGLEIVVVNSALVVAPSDPGWTGRLLRRTVAGRRPVSGGAPMSWVWVEDAALGIVRAATRGTDGERYILSGDVLSSHAFLAKLAAWAGAPPPRKLPESMVVTGAVLATALATPLRKRPRLTLDEARFLTSGCRVDGSHASTELGFAYTPASRYIPVMARDYRHALQRFSAERAG